MLSICMGRIERKKVLKEYKIRCVPEHTTTTEKK